jgi:hypothetical protein
VWTAVLTLALAWALGWGLSGCAALGPADRAGPEDPAADDRAATQLRSRRAAVRGLLRDLARAVDARPEGPGAGAPGAAALRGSYRGCASDALTAGYRSWTYAGGGRVPGDATLREVARALRRVGATRVVHVAGEVRAHRDDVEVAVVGTRGAVVLSARAEPCVDVPPHQEEAWFDREPHPEIPLGG